MIQDLSDVIENFVQQIDPVITGTWDSATKTFFTTDYKYARIGKKVTDGANKTFLITNISGNLLTLKPLTSTLNVSGNITLPEPFYITGTRLATNNEWNEADRDLMKKTPLAWLLETIRMKVYGRGSSYDWESEFRIFFLDETNVTQYYTADHREQVVKPMTKLAQMFIDIITNDFRFVPFEDYELITFSRFGVEQENGMFQNVLDANLSGVELRLRLIKYKPVSKCSTN